MTTREWFRIVRRAYTPGTMEEQHALMAIHGGHWLEAEFWTMLAAGRLLAAGDTPREHRWWLDELFYLWRCVDCDATVPSDTIGETEPPAAAFSKDCHCPACLPCGY